MKKKFNIEGMTCAACQAHVSKAVEKISGVSFVNVNLLQNTMVVEYNEKICSANLIEKAVEDAGYKALQNNVEPKKENKDYKLPKLIVSLFFLLILMYVSMGHMMLGWPVFKIFDMEENPFGFGLIQLILVLPIMFIYRYYFVKGFKNLFKKAPNMDTLIAIGATASIVYGIFSLIMIKYGIMTKNDDIIERYHMSLYFESVGMILLFVSIGKYLEEKSKKKTTESISKLVKLAPQKAVVIVNGLEMTKDINEVKTGDIILVKKGESIPVDGTIINGSCSVDQSNITGESIPVFKAEGDFVYSSTIISSGYIKLKAEKVGEDTSISNIIKLVEEASNSKAPISKLADKISGIFVPVILLVSILVFVVNYLFVLINNPFYVTTRAFETALNAAITVVVIACPCALGLATPVAIMVGTGKGAENGLLIKNAEILEKAHNIKTVVLDKTGTLTNGKPSVVEYVSFVNESNINYIFSLENKSEHPLAQAIVEFCQKNNAKELEVLNYKTIDGKGVLGIVDGQNIYIGNTNYLDKELISNEIQEKLDNFSQEGKTPLIVLKNNIIVSIITIKDELKENSKEAINYLKKDGIDVVMLTGDNAITANVIAQEVGIEKVYSDVLPTEKQKIINSLKSDEKHLVAMVGDGVNDALALTSADLGIAIGAGSDVAIESADIVLLKNDLLDVKNVISLSKKVLKTIKIGLFWAFFYNSICVIVATGIFYYISKGSFKMEPMYGSIAMSVSSVSVVLNALTINLFKPIKKEKTNEDICQNIKEENMKTVIKVDGMMCKHCKAHVEEAITKIEGVISVVADLASKEVSIESTKELNIAEVEAAVTNAGYEVIK